MKSKQKNLDIEVRRILDLLEKKKNLYEIKTLFPRTKKKLEDIFETIDFLFKSQKVFDSPIELENKILAQIRLKLMKSENKVAIGRASLTDLFKNQFQTLMTAPFKIILPVLLVLVIGIGFGITRFGGKKTPDVTLKQENKVAFEQETLPQEVNKPSASEPAVGKPTALDTGAASNIDGVVTSILEDAENDVVLLKDLDKEGDFVEYDSQEVDDFGQSINENDY